MEEPSSKLLYSVLHFYTELFGCQRKVSIKSYFLFTLTASQQKRVQLVNQNCYKSAAARTTSHYTIWSIFFFHETQLFMNVTISRWDLFEKRDNVSSFMTMRRHQEKKIFVGKKNGCRS